MKMWGLILAAALLCCALAGCAVPAGAAEEGAASALGEDRAEVYGRVTAAQGNEITLAVGVPAEEGAGPSGEAPDGEEAPGERSGAGGDTGDAGKGRRRESASGAAAAAGQGAITLLMAGGPPDGGGAPQGDVQGRQGAPGGIKLSLTGEERTYLIPVGTPVYISSGAAQITTDFMQIVVDNNVRLILRRDGDQETVVAAYILS